jgi:Neuraminidase (sialidase)
MEQNNNRVIQLANGRLLIPVALFDLLSPGSVWHKAGTIFVYYSDDNGKTWQSSKEMPNPDRVGTQEPGVAKLKNGNLLMFMRTNGGVQYVSYSEDQRERDMESCPTW